ncbi:MAG: transposase [Parcubacteria group bacterium]|nr:transposase [Parcubacteria group bacterium]
MVRQARQFNKGDFWHVFNRGVAKEVIFKDDNDFRFYLSRVTKALQKFPVKIHGYNLFVNHVHYLIEQHSDIPPSKFIGSVHGSFGLFINRKYSRVGHLFQDRFKANNAGDDLLPISVYTNLNKVFDKLENTEKKVITKLDLDHLLQEAEKDAWSSYGVYLGLRDDKITQTKHILSLLSDDIKQARKEYKKFARKLIVSGYFLKTRDLIFEEYEADEDK